MNLPSERSSDRKVHATSGWPSLLNRPWFLWLWCTIAAFGAYACMYAFRKPFTVGKYIQPPFGENMKTWLILAQVLGYTLSKCIGIRVISEMPIAKRGLVLMGLVGSALLALFLFAILPSPLKPICLFLNGLPLGMVYGLVLGFLEGRRLTEAFVAGLCASFILADGFTKSVGASLLKSGVPEVWMPFVAGLIFLFPLAGFVGMLVKIPPPSPSDVLARSERTPMHRSDRRLFFKRHAGGLLGLLLMYLLVTILRSVRSDFSPELWSSLGAKPDSARFTQSETWVALGVLVLHGIWVGIQNNRRAFFAGLGIALSGTLVLGLALVRQRLNRLDPFSFVVMTGVGLYLPYVAAHTILFERLMAMTRDRGNMGYLMYLADAVGYLGYAGVVAVHTFLPFRGDFLPWFSGLAWLVVGGSVLGLGTTALFYRR